MGPHDAISDDGDRVVCACGRVYEGPKARDRHADHFRLEGLRVVLAEAKEKASGS